MKLLYTPIDGYVHTCEAVVNYAALHDSIEPVPTRPYDEDTTLPQINPLGKVPTLIMDNGEYLAGGPVIYEYLDSLHDKEPLYPPSGLARWTTLRQAWLADGLFDTLVMLIVESWLDSPEQRTAYSDRLLVRLRRMLAVMNNDARQFQNRNIAWFRFVGSLSFLDRVAGRLESDLEGREKTSLTWRDNVPKLAAWHDTAVLADEFTMPLLRQQH